MERFLSFVIPFFDEEDNLRQLWEELNSVYFSTLSDRWQGEVIFVDDGSRDASVQVVQDIARSSQLLKVRIIRMNANYGLSAALDAGLRAANGDIVVTLDADLQNDPADIPALIETVEAGYDAAVGIRRRRDDPPVKRLSSKVANAVRSAVLRDRIIDSACTLRAVKRDSLQRIKLFNGLHRFIPSLLLIEGANVAQIEVNHRPRLHGRSKYNLLNRLTGPFVDLWAVLWMRRRSFRYHASEEDL